MKYFPKLMGLLCHLQHMQPNTLAREKVREFKTREETAADFFPGVNHQLTWQDGHDLKRGWQKNALLITCLCRRSYFLMLHLILQVWATSCRSLVGRSILSCFLPHSNRFKYRRIWSTFHLSNTQSTLGGGENITLSCSSCMEERYLPAQQYHTACPCLGLLEILDRLKKNCSSQKDRAVAPKVIFPHKNCWYWFEVDSQNPIQDQKDRMVL